MDSSKKTKKSRKKISIIRSRQKSSVSNRSQSSFHHITPAGKYKCRIKTLSKNNKLLACALQETRCELSTKQNIVDDLSKSVNNMMFARLKMVAMHSTLKSFLKDFEEALILLKVDQSNCREVPSRSCNRKWNNLLKKVEEAIEDSMQHEEEEIVDMRVETVENSCNQLSNVDVTSEELACGIKIGNSCHNVDTDEEETGVISMNVHKKSNANEKNDEGEEHLLPDQTASIHSSDTNHKRKFSSLTVLPNETYNDFVAVREEEGFHRKKSHPKNEGLKIFEPNSYQKSVISTEPSTELKAESLSHPEKSQISTNASDTSLRTHISKIPKIQVSSFKKKLKNPLNNKKNTEKKVTGESDEECNLSKRKTFVINKAERNPLSKPSVISSKIELNENVCEENGQSCKRKTFVIKSSEALGNINSFLSDDGNETFIKKSSDVSSPSIKNRRGTFLVSKSSIQNINIENDACLGNYDNEKLISSESSEFRCSDSVNIEAKSHINNIQQNKPKFLSAEKSNDGSSCEEEIPKVKLSSDIQNPVPEILDDVTICDLPNSNRNVLEVDQTKSPSDSFLELSGSKCEPVPELDFLSVQDMSPIKKTPIRRQVSKCGKVFVFGNSKKPILDKTPLTSESSPKFSLHPDAVRTNNDIESYCQSVENQEIEKVGIIEYCVESEDKTDCNEHSSLDITKKGNDVTADVKKMKAKTRKIYKCSKAELKEGIISVASKSDNIENENSSNIASLSTKISNENFSKGVKVFVFGNNKKTIDKTPLSSEKSPKSSLHPDSVRTNNDVESCSQSVENQEVEKEKNIECCVERDDKTSCTEHSNLDTIKKENDITAGVKKIKAKTRKTYKCSKAELKEDIISVSSTSDCIEKENPSSIAALSTKISNEKPSEIALDSLSAKNRGGRAYKKRKIMNLMAGCAVDDISLLRDKDQNKSKGKSRKRESKAKKHATDEKKQLSCKTNKNTFLVHAEVHPIPPSLNVPEIKILDKENAQIQGREVSVVLNDIFQSKNSKALCTCGYLHEDETSSSKTDLPHNSDENLLSVNIHQNDKNSSNFEGGNYSRRQRKAINYKEPSIGKKMRQ